MKIHRQFRNSIAVCSIYHDFLVSELILGRQGITYTQLMSPNYILSSLFVKGFFIQILFGCTNVNTIFNVI
jgi:hypothetical protein